MKQFEKGIDRVTVTGSPVIGKSLFLAYFFTQYCTQNPTATVIVASFTTGVMDEVLVWTHEQMEHANEQKEAMLELIQRAEAKAKDEGRPFIRLYDGLPSQLPPRSRVMCCANACHAMHDKERADPRQVTLYMPVWDSDELTGGEEVLYLHMEPPPVDFEIAEERFNTFGGIARVCLSDNEEYVKQTEARLLRTIERISNRAVMVHYALNAENTDWAEVLGGTSIYVPEEGNPLKFTTESPSTYIRHLAVERMMERGF
ncbi:hypothetical protein Poli38472_007738 [Pythium oligandrum]|uniref:Uncharacterized protein n=1 Tax=Pythium oligandrum TaxID=41045 RepID=A0A8K1CSY3_PYTOL|nr:hypothetical protein Poli38472_007738 [Pythium oligandrum]|eukprot:TMW68066.1 hypothetical protein Poli38472_007738 [Pythium oligandrum]